MSIKNTKSDAHVISSLTDPESLNPSMIEYHARSLQVAHAVVREASVDYYLPDAERLSFDSEEIDTAVSVGFIQSHVCADSAKRRFSITETGRRALIYKFSRDLERIHKKSASIQESIFDTVRSGLTNKK